MLGSNSGGSIGIRPILPAEGLGSGDSALTLVLRVVYPTGNNTQPSQFASALSLDSPGTHSSGQAEELIQWGVVQRVRTPHHKLLGLLVGCLLFGCGESQPSPRVIRLVSFRQSEQTGVFLNETLVFHFSAELDRSSVTRSSISIESMDGFRARGGLEVQGANLLFTPKAPLLADFSDAGLLPGKRYRVSVTGFPSPDGVRGHSGEPLRQTYVRFFETIDVRTESGPRFEDRSPDRAYPLQLETLELRPFDPIRLRCGEPVDPSTLFPEDFLLQHAESLEPIPLRVDLFGNDENGATIELRPVDSEGQLRALPANSIWLWMDPSLSRLRDFGGHPVLPVWLANPAAGRLEVTDLDEWENKGSYVESFLDTRRSSPEQVAESAGTARWSDGVVTIRFPAAAGSGGDGRVALRGDESRSDIHAIELDVAEGEVARLTGKGPVILRSQGRMTIDGSLRRDVEGKQTQAEELGLVEYSDWHRWTNEREEWAISGMEFEEGESLSSWLDRAKKLDLPWTVIVAGGDLVIRGQVWLDGPLLLVSGGRILASGEIRARPGQLWTFPEPLASWSPIMPRLASLALDAPKLNPLREPLTWTIKSTPPPSPFGLKSWRLVGVHSEERGGSIRIGYLGELHDAGSVKIIGPVDRPELLEDCDTIRLRIDLTMAAGGLATEWDPPILDTVELAWEEIVLKR